MATFLTPNWNTRTRCLLSNWNETDILALEEKYAQAKCYGIRASLGVVTGAGVISVGKEVSKGVLQYYGRRWLGTALVTVGGYFGFAGVPLLTNATKVVRYGKACHNCFATIMDASETTAGIPLIALEFAVFGRPVPKKPNSTFSLYPESSDFVNKYYEGRGEYTLYQLRGYMIKYESIKSILFMTNKIVSKFQRIKNYFHKDKNSRLLILTC